MDLFIRLSEEIEAKRPVVLVTLIKGEGAGQKLLVGPGPAVLAGSLADDAARGRALQLAEAALLHGRPRAENLESGLRLYVEPMLPPPVLVVVGGGHVAQPLAALGKMTGFEVIVIDDRPAWVNRERFPTADEIICADFLPALGRLNLGPRHHVVLVTRGHKHDLDCLREVVDKGLPYVGMIGSRRRVKGVFERMVEEGKDPALLKKVYSPIGLDIGAETPAEIAVSVVGELIMLRRGGTGLSLSGESRAAVHRDRRAPPPVNPGIQGG